MNETTYIYIVHSDINENNIYAEFKTEKEAIDYARRNSDELTYVDKVEVALDEEGEVIEMFDSETIWVYEDEIEELDLLMDDEDEDDYWDMRADLDDTTWFESLDTEALVEKMEENEDMVECKECFDLFPKVDGIKVELGYVCPHCHQATEFPVSYTEEDPDFEIGDEDIFKLDFPELEKFRDPDSEFANAEPAVPNAAPEEPSVEPACVGPECEVPVEAPVTKEETITTLVKDEHEAIDGYDKAKVEIEANSELDEKEKEEILDTIEHIKEEEIEHIEELEELTKEVIHEALDKLHEAPSTGDRLSAVGLGATIGSTLLGGTLGPVGLVAGGLLGDLIIKFADKAKEAKNVKQIQHYLEFDPELKEAIENLILETNENDTQKILGWIEDYYANKYFEAPEDVKEDTEEVAEEIVDELADVIETNELELDFVEDEITEDDIEEIEDLEIVSSEDLTEASEPTPTKAGIEFPQNPYSTNIARSSTTASTPAGQSKNDEDSDDEYEEKMKKLKQDLELAKMTTKVQKAKAKAQKATAKATKVAAKVNPEADQSRKELEKAKVDAKVQKVKSKINPEADEKRKELDTAKLTTKVQQAQAKTAKTQTKQIKTDTKNTKLAMDQIKLKTEKDITAYVNELINKGLSNIDIVKQVEKEAENPEVVDTPEMEKFIDEVRVEESLRRESLREQVTRTLTEAKWKVSKESFKELIEGQDDLQVAFGDPREWGYITRDWYAADLGNGRYELYAHDIDINDDVHEFVDSIEFDSFDEFWKYLTEILIADGDFMLEFDVVGEESLVEGSGIFGRIILDDYFKKDGERNPNNKNGTGYWVDLIDPDTKKSILKPEDKTVVQELKKAEEIADSLSRAEDGWAVIKVEGAQGWNGILEVYEKGKRTQDISKKKLEIFNKAWDEQEAKKKARQELDKKLGKTKDKKDSDTINITGDDNQTPREDEEEQDTTVNNSQEQETTQTNTQDQEVVHGSGPADATNNNAVPKNSAAVKATKDYNKIIAALKKIGIADSEIAKLMQGKKPTDALRELRKLLFTESLEEHVNEEHPAIESEQELAGTDNAVVDCKVNKVITHSEDEKPVDCKGEKKPLKKPLTESEAMELAEYWWSDNDPMNWSDYDPIVYSVTYKGKLVGYVKFDYMGYETYPEREEIEHLITLLLDDIDTIPEDYSMADVDYDFADYYDMDEDLPIIEE